MAPDTGASDVTSLPYGRESRRQAQPLANQWPDFLPMLEADLHRRPPVKAPWKIPRIQPDQMRAAAAEPGLMRRKGRADRDLCGPHQKGLAPMRDCRHLQALLVQLRFQRARAFGQHRTKRPLEIEIGRNGPDPGIARLGPAESTEPPMPLG